MTPLLHPKNTVKANTILKSMAVILVFLLAVFGKSVFRDYVHLPIETPLLKIVYGYSWWIFPGLLCTGIIFGFKNMGENLGFSSSPTKALLFSLIATSPMFISSALIGQYNDSLPFIQLLHGTFFAGFMEEFLFRGFLFGLLFRKLGWGFVPAGLVGALIFGWAHLHQGTSVTETFGIFRVALGEIAV